MWYILDFTGHTFVSAETNEEAAAILRCLIASVGNDNIEVINGFIDGSRMDADSWLEEYEERGLTERPAS